MPTPISLTYTSFDGSTVRRTFQCLAAAQAFAQVLVGNRPTLELDLPIPQAVSWYEKGVICVDGVTLLQLFPELDRDHIDFGSDWDDFGPEFEVARNEEAQAREDAHGIRRAEIERCPFAIQAVRPSRCPVTDGITGSYTRTLARFGTEAEAHARLVEFCRENEDEDGAPLDDEVCYRLRVQRWSQDEWKGWKLVETKGEIELEQERKAHEEWVKRNQVLASDDGCLY